MKGIDSARKLCQITTFSVVNFLTSINLQKIYQDIEIQTIRKHAWYFVPKIVETLVTLRFSIVNGTCKFKLEKPFGAFFILKSETIELTF